MTEEGMSDGIMRPAGYKQGQKRLIAFSVLNAVIAGLFPTMVYLIALGANAFELGLYQGVVSVAIFAHFVTPLLIARFRKADLVSVGHGLAGLTVFGMGVIPILALGRAQGIYLAIFWGFVSGIFTNVASMAWWPLLQDNVPEEETGKFFSTMRTMLSVVAIAFTFFSGWYIGGRKDPRFFVPLVMVAGALSVARAFIVWRTPETWSRQDIDARSIMHRFKGALQDKSFRSALLLTMLFYGCWGSVIPPVFNSYLKELGYQFGSLIKLAAVSSIGTVVSLWLWARLVDRHGTRPLLVPTVWALFALMVAKAFVPEAGAVGSHVVGLIMIYAISLLDGVFFAGGLRLLATKIHFRAIGKASQAEAFMLMTAGPAVLGMFLPPLAGKAIGYLNALNFKIPGTAMGSYALVIILTSLLFAGGLFFRRSLPRYVDEKSSLDLLRKFAVWRYMGERRF